MLSEIAQTYTPPSSCRWFFKYSLRLFSLSLSLSLFLFLSPTLSLSILTFLASLTLSSSLAFVGVLLPNPRQFQLDKPRQDHLVFLVEVKYSDLYRNDWYLRNLLALDQWSSQIECYFSISIEKLYYNIFTIHFYISLLKGSSILFFLNFVNM